MDNYFAIVKVKVWDEDGADFYEDMAIFKAIDEADLGAQLKKHYDNTLSKYSVEWVGDGSGCLYIDADIAEKIKELN